MSTSGYYCVNTNPQPNGDHEVHLKTCDRLPRPEHQIQLGYHYGCATAVAEAKKYYWKSNGCFYCARLCNTG